MKFELGILFEKTKNLKHLGEELSSKMYAENTYTPEIKQIYRLISEIHNCMSDIKDRYSDK